MNNWEQRKIAGTAHEERIAEELAARGWNAAPWGQGILPPPIREALSRSESRWKHFPDLVAARDGDVVTIDGKDRMRSTETDRYAISRECVSFGLQFLAAFGIPVFYVFGNLGVLTPTEVQSYGTLGPRSRGGAYYLVPGRIGHHFDDVFGAPESGQIAA
jgi:Holliday junction resolvase